MGCGCNKNNVIQSTSISSVSGNWYIPFTQASQLFMNRFSLSQLDFDTSKEELIPYFTKILEYLNYRLMILGSDDIKTQLCEVFDIFDEGNDAIIQTPDYKNLLKEILEKEDYSMVDSKVAYIIKAHKDGGQKEHWEEADELFKAYELYLAENDKEWPEECGEVYENAVEWAKHIGIDIPECGPEHDRFILAWGHGMTALCMRLRLQYAYLWDQEPSGDDCCSCSRGETTDDYESWVSNVYSNDETSDRTNYFRGNSPWQISKNRLCDCYRHSSETSDKEDNDSDGQYTSLKDLFSGTNK